MLLKHNRGSALLRTSSFLPQIKQQSTRHGNQIINPMLSKHDGSVLLRACFMLHGASKNVFQSALAPSFVPCSAVSSVTEAQHFLDKIASILVG